MTTRGPGRPKAHERRDLRAALLATSRELLNKEGPGALSMREVARRAGYTHQAPYHYFENREALLAALVADGFRELADQLGAANDRAETDGVSVAVEASGNAYVGFALANPGVFRIMFRPDMCDPSAFPTVLEESARARAELGRLARIAHGQRASPEREILLWSHVHGLASLLLDGALAIDYPTTEARLAYARTLNRLAVPILLMGLPGPTVTADFPTAIPGSNAS